MKLIEFFDKEYDGPKGRIIFMSCVGTSSFSAAVSIISEVAAAPGKADTVRLLFLYLTLCVITLICRQYTLTRVTIMAEEVVRRVRVRFIDKLRHTELQFFESTQKGDIYARITRDTDFISDAATDAMNFFESILTSVFIFAYLIFLSPAGFVGIFAFTLALFGIFLINYDKIKQRLKAASMKESDLFGALNDTLSGFKEIRINSKKNDALFADIETLAMETRQLKTEAGMKNVMNIMFAFVLYQGLMGIIVFAVPLFGHSQVVTKLVSLMMFVFGLLTALARGIPVIIESNVVVENLERVEARIDSFEVLTSTEPGDVHEDFREIAFRSVTFRYAGKQGEVLFDLGPVDLTIRQGEILFIVGGNGSGKSTLMKLLTGLYYPMADDGFIALDDRKITPENYQSYRELFSIIFTDFHLFEKLYGSESVEETRVKNLLEVMDIHKKTDYVGGKFTNLDLSTGQKKRLAYIAALLEDKPIYVFDEWAADQDPEFRKLFYEKFLRDLKAINKTVIAVTHDDRYFGMADRVLKMEEGRITEIS